MRFAAQALLVSLALAGAGCAAAGPPVDYATMPTDAAGTPVLSDQGAIQFASYALGSPGRTAGKPGSAARALAAIEYLSGALYANPRWTGFPAITKVQMVQGRQEVRALLNIPPAAPSQAVVNGLIAAANALDAGNSQAATAALSSPVFGLGPQRTVALLTNLPALPQANVAAQQANYAITYECDSTQTC